MLSFFLLVLYIILTDIFILFNDMLYTVCVYCVYVSLHCNLDIH